MTHDEPLIASIDYQVTQRDLEIALRYPTWDDPKNRGKLLRWWLGGVLAAILLDVAAYRLFGERMLPFFAAPVVISLQWPFLLRSQAKGLAKVHAKQPGALETARMIVRPDALVIASKQAEVRVDWHAIKDIANTGEYTLFILGRFQVLALPWRAFESPSAAQRLSQLAQQYWLTAQAAAPGSDVVAEEVLEALGPDRLAVKYELTMADIRALIAVQVLRKRWLLPGLLLTSIVLGLCMSLFDGPQVGAATGIGFLLVMLAVIVGAPLLNAKQAKGVLGPHTLIAAPIGYWTQAPGIASSIQRWSTLTGIEANARHVLLFRGPDFVVGIPRRAFSSSAEVDRFLAQITRWRLGQMAEVSPHAPV